ncbi:MAG: hypothetical protein ABUL62_07510 [Myxococcales bacterium]
MRFSWLVTAGVCAWLVACGGSSHKKALECDASECGPDEAAGTPGMVGDAGAPSAGGRDAGVDMEPDASLEAGAGGAPPEPEAGATGAESELQVVIVGNGTVAVSGAAACLSSACTYAAIAGTSFSLQAKPGADSRFVGWSGDCAGSKPNTSVAVNGVTACTATFVVQRAVAAAVAGDGGGSVVSDPDLSCGATGCNGEVDNHSTVKLTATPASGFGFVKWTGSRACDGLTQAVISVEVTQDLSCNATFAKQFQLAVSAAGASVQVGVKNDGCDALTCSANADSSASFHAAVAPSGFRFTGWSGDAACTGTDNPLVVAHRQQHHLRGELQGTLHGDGRGCHGLHGQRASVVRERGRGVPRQYLLARRRNDGHAEGADDRRFSPHGLERHWLLGRQSERLRHHRDAHDGEHHLHRGIRRGRLGFRHRGRRDRHRDGNFDEPRRYLHSGRVRHRRGRQRDAQRAEPAAGLSLRELDG